jgi:hypothetical protein
VIDHHPRDLVSGALKLIRELLHEDTEIRSGGARIHLRDEEYSHN